MDSGALVHEAYLKLAGGCAVELKDRDHFLAVAAKAMRHVLVDYARQRSAEKRGGAETPIPLEESKVGAQLRVTEVLDLNRALDALAKLDGRLAQLVELRFFAGLTSKGRLAVALEGRCLGRGIQPGRALRGGWKRSVRAGRRGDPSLGLRDG